MDSSRVFNRRQKLSDLALAASSAGRERLLSKLLASGASVDSLDGMSSPLSNSAICGSLGCLEILIDAGADLDWQDPDGMSAVMEAALFGQAGALGLLLRRGADPCLKTASGRGALFLACSEGFGAEAALLGALCPGCCWDPVSEGMGPLELGMLNLDVSSFGSLLNCAPEALLPGLSRWASQRLLEPSWEGANLGSNMGALSSKLLSLSEALELAGDLRIPESSRSFL